MELLLLRHAETPGNLLKRYIGRTDEPLHEKGVSRAQAIAWDGGLPPIERIYVSPLLRARQTAELVFPRAEQVVIEDLREMDFGIFEGRSADEMAEDARYRAWVDAHCEPSCPGGESREEFEARTHRVFLTLIAEALQAGEERLGIVAHGGSCATIMGRWARPQRPYYTWFVPNCGGYRVSIAEDRWERDGVFSDWAPLFSEKESAAEH